MPKKKGGTTACGASFEGITYLLRKVNLVDTNATKAVVTMIITISIAVIPELSPVSGVVAAGAVVAGAVVAGAVVAGAVVAGAVVAGGDKWFSCISRTGETFK